MASRDAALIRENYQSVCGAIERAANGRTVELVCVTKYAREEWLPLLLEAGARHLGENLLPAAAQRLGRLRNTPAQFSTHLLGAQQSRKLKDIAGAFDWYQALGSAAAADALERNSAEQSLPRKLKVLLQVNVGAEAQKQGADREAVEELAHHVAINCTALELRGLMAIPPGPAAYGSLSEFESGTRRHFAALRQMFDKIGTAVGPSSGVTAWDTLSMGMSQDYVWAVQEGATMVRVGTALFEGLEG